MKEFLKKLCASKGSDLVLVAGYPALLRINDEFQKVDDKVLSAEEVEALIAGIISKDNLAEIKDKKELDIAYEDEMSRYRINLHYQRGGMAAAIRRISKDIPALEDLGLPGIVKSFTTLERGLVLVTGPTGSGKSTTQAAMIDVINKARSVHIITIEDPIEYIHSKKFSIIEQREVGIDTASFGEALKRVLRQVPDVILVGEMRDLESIQMAITAAETGHLVISTLHTQDAVQSIDRIIDVFPPHQQSQVRMQLSLTLQGIISQQLIPKKEGKGLVLASEVIVINPGIRNIIRKGATQDIYSMIELGKQQGMINMDACLVNLFKQGLISKETCITYALNRERLEKLLA